MVEDRTRVDFDAPTSLVQRVDALAQLLDTSRTQLLVDALRDELDALARNEDVRREIREGFYDERVDFETVESVMGTEEALRMRGSLLRTLAKDICSDTVDSSLERCPDYLFPRRESRPFRAGVKPTPPTRSTVGCRPNTPRLQTFIRIGCIEISTAK